MDVGGQRQQITCHPSGKSSFLVVDPFNKDMWGSKDSGRQIGKPPRIEFLDGLRGYAIFMVVATHAIAYAGLGSYERSLIEFWVQSIAVPSFFLVDGYLFVHGLQCKENFLYQTYVSRSSRRLLIPWIVFNIVFTIFRAIFETVGHPAVTIVLGHTPIEVLKAIYYSQIAAQLYFLPALLLIRSLSVMTRFFVRLRMGAKLILVVGYILLWQMVSMRFHESDGLDPVWHAFWGMQYYLLGMLLVNCQNQFSRNPLALAGIALICLLGLKLGGVESLDILSQFVYLLGLYFLFLALGSRGYPFTVLGTFTMGIYLFHAPIVLKMVTQLVSVFFESGGVIPYVAITLLAVFISFALAWLCSGVSWCRWALGESRLTP